MFTVADLLMVTDTGLKSLHEGNFLCCVGFLFGGGGGGGGGGCFWGGRGLECRSLC